MPRPSRRDDVVDSAMKLFAEEGFHAVGIDRILSKGGLAKMTLYRHFDSKQALILASLEARNRRATIVSAVELAGYLEAEDLAGELMVLKEGATVLAQIHGSAEPVQHARRTARARLRAWLRA
jgi:AcrR family transcriptional regulator